MSAVDLCRYTPTLQVHLYTFCTDKRICLVYASFKLWAMVMWYDVNFLQKSNQKTFDCYNCFAGHDSALLSKWARRVVESELQISTGCHLHIYGLHFDCCEPICSPSTHIWQAYDGAVQGQNAWRTLSTCVCHCRFCISSDETRVQEPIYPCKQNLIILSYHSWTSFLVTFAAFTARQCRMTMH